MNLENFIDPSLLIALVTVLVTLFQFKKSNFLKYITEERRNWRLEIRELMVELENYIDNRTTINQTLVKIKGRINAYGLNHGKSYNKDYHIWKIIKQIEHPRNDDTLKYDVELLINSLALLLKADWERSKIEIEGDKYSYFNNTLLVSSIFIFIFMIATDFNQIKTSTSDFSLIFIPALFYIGFCFLAFFLIWIGPDKLFANLKKIQKHPNMFSRKEILFNKVMEFFNSRSHKTTREKEKAKQNDHSELEINFDRM